MSRLLDSTTIAEFCRLVREREEKSIREFAERIEHGYANISRVESGQYAMPIEYLQKLTEFLNLAEIQHLEKLISEEAVNQFRGGK